MSAMPEYVSSQPTLVAAPDLSYRRSMRSSPGVRAERYINSILLTIISTALLAFWIGGHVQLTVQGYGLKKLQTRLTCVQESNRLLTEESAQLGALSRVSGDAPGRLSMVAVVPSETIQIGSNSPSPATSKILRRPLPSTVAMAPRP